MKDQAITAPDQHALPNQRSHRPLWSALGDPLSQRLCFLDSGRLCAAARRRTGLEDFGDPAIEPALSVLARSLEEEAGLHPLGRFLMRAHLLSLLETRLRLAEFWRGQSAALAASPVQRPVFITGMPRSGSTFLHELLAEDPGNRAPRVWEVMFPVPGPNAGGPGRDPRVRKAAACLWWFRRLAPQADTVFPMRASTPHECVAIHSYSLLSEEFISTCRVPSYEAYLHAADLRPAYAWQRRFLQHLQLSVPARRWVLKSPDHVQGLEALFSVFPDALIIQTHRNPLEVLKSSCQLTEVLYGLYAWRGKRDQLAARESRVLAERLDRFVQFRDVHPELADRFIDVRYTDLVSDPLAVIRRIYRQFDMPLTNATIEQVQLLASRRSRYGNRSATTTPDDVGFAAPAEASSFDRYCSRFGISRRQLQPR
jgi:hypothetical protein